MSSTGFTADNPHQQARLKNLKSEIERVAHTRSDVSGPEGARRTEATVPHSLSRAMREFRAEELALLTARVTASSDTAQRLRRVLLLVAVGSALLLLWVFGLVVVDERRRRQAEGALRRTNDELD